MPVSRYLAVVLLIITLCMGVLLVQTRGQLATVETNLEHTQEKAEKLEEDLDSQKEETGVARAEYHGCQTSLQGLNKQLKEQSAAALAQRDASHQRADKVLSTLPTLIKSDRTASVTADSANLWLKELFQ